MYEIIIIIKICRNIEKGAEVLRALLSICLNWKPPDITVMKAQQVYMIMAEIKGKVETIQTTELLLVK